MISELTTQFLVSIGHGNDDLVANTVTVRMAFKGRRRHP